MFFWNSLAFSMIEWMLAIWSLVPLLFLRLHKIYNVLCLKKKKKEKIYTLNYRLFNILFTPICIILLCRSRTRLSDFTFTFHFHALEKEMATHSSILAWRIPRTGEPGGLPSMGSHRVGHDWSDLAAAVVYIKVFYKFLTSWWHSHVTLSHFPKK